jgi:hypothetical protein
MDSAVGGQPEPAIVSSVGILLFWVSSIAPSAVLY